MAKITVAGNVFVVTSDFTLEDLKRVERFRPDALTLKDEEGDPTFIVKAGCSGGIMSGAVIFAESTRDGRKAACVTCKLPEIPENKDVRDVLADEIGGIITNLSKIEEALPAVLDEINAEHAAIAEAIDMA